MFYEPYDRLMGHLRVIRMSIVNRVILPFAYITHKGCPFIGIGCLIIGLAVSIDEIVDIGIWTCRVIGWFGKGENVLIFSNGKTFYISDGVEKL